MTSCKHGFAKDYVLVHDPDPNGLAVPGHRLHLNAAEIYWGLRFGSLTTGTILERRGRRYQITHTGSLKPLS